MWLTMLPGFPDGSYGWARVDRMLGDALGPRLYVEPVGQGDSDKPRDYRYSTIERADLVQALWRHHGVRRTVVVTFDYTSLALLELLRRQLERDHRATPAITAALMVNGGLFADAHTHPWRTTPMLRTPLGALGMQRAQRSPRVFDATILQARLYSRGYHPTAAELAELRSAITRRDGAAFLHRGAGFTAEHRRHARRWDLAEIARDLGGTVALYVGGSDEDPYEHRQIQATRERVPQAGVLAFPGGHLTTSEHPGPPRRGHPRHRRTPRRGHPRHRQPVTPEGESRRDQDDPPARAQRAVRPYLHPRGAGRTRPAAAHRHLPRPPG